MVCIIMCKVVNFFPFISHTPLMKINLSRPLKFRTFKSRTHIIKFQMCRILNRKRYRLEGEGRLSFKDVTHYVKSRLAFLVI